MLRKRKILLEHDHKILAFLWMWKIASTRALEKKFFQNTKPSTAYDHLLRLRRSKFIESVITDNFGGHVWTLSKKGFSAIKHLLPELKEDGFKSESVNHDLLVQAFQIGEWLTSKPEGLQVFTEQQLRRYPKDFYPSWINYSDMHRPDGYTLVPGPKPMVIAVEIEITPKTIERYTKVAIFYRDNTNIDRVFWVVDAPSSARRIQNQIGKSVSNRNDIHNYLLVGDFKTNGWKAKIIAGPDKGLSMSEYLSKQVARMWPESGQMSGHQALLTLTKSYIKSNRYPNQAKT